MTRHHAGPNHSPSARCQPMYHRVFRADRGAVRATLLSLRRRFSEHVSPDTIGRLELALAEVLNNISEHGGLSLTDATARPQPLAKAPIGHTHPHPRPGVPTVHLCVIQQATGISCAVTDDGVPLPENCLLPFEAAEYTTYRSREQLSGELPEGGFGWFLIQDLTRAICYYREDQRNFLAFTIPYPESLSNHSGAQPLAQPPVREG